MAANPVKVKSKKTSRGQRKHVRRLKQESRKGSLPDNQIKKRARVSVPLKV